MKANPIRTFTPSRFRVILCILLLIAASKAAISEVKRMEPIFNHSGNAVAWLRDTDIYDLSGAHLAVLNHENVYGHSGQHLGLFKNGLFRDHQGGVVAFIRNASGGPIRPIPAIPPVPPIPAIPPIPPIPAIPSLGWGIDWEEFIDG